MTPKIERRFNKIDRELLQLVDQLKAYDDEALNKKPGPGKWSVLQVMHHLVLAESAAFRYLRKKMQHDPRFKRAGFPSWLRSITLQLGFLLPIKFKAPDAVGDKKIPDISSLEEISEKWLKLRSELRIYSEQLPVEFYSKAIYKHPIGGRMSLFGMLGFFGGHFRRHRQQIHKCLKS